MKKYNLGKKRDICYNGSKEWVTPENKTKEAIISEDQFWRVQEKLDRRARSLWGRGNGAKSIYELTGIATCGICGYRLFGHRKFVHEKEYFYYDCGGSYKLGKRKCKHGYYMINREYLESTVWNRIKERYLSLDRQDNIVKYVLERLNKQFDTSEHEIREKDKKIRDIDSKISIILDSVSEENKDLINQKLSELRKEKEWLVSERDRLSLNGTTKIDAHNLIKDIKYLLSNFGYLKEQGTPKQKREFIQKFVGKLAIYPNKNEMVVGFYILPRTPEKVFSNLQTPVSGIFKIF